MVDGSVFASRRRQTRCALVTGVQTCALPISPTPAILVAVGDITIFGCIIVGRDGRDVAAPTGKGPVAAIVAAQHIDVSVRLFIAERRDDPEAVVEIIAEHRRAGGFPAADFAALADRKSTPLNSSP